MKIKSWLSELQNLLKLRFVSSINNRKLDGLLALSLATIVLPAFKDSALAQNITIDGTISTQQTLNGPTYNIQQSFGQTVNNNLFHSFGKFNLNAGEIANFESAANIRNIFSRVTGNEASIINGVISTSSNNVNLFLLNPKGFLFGPNAQIDIGGSTRGSFVATTLDALIWPNGEQFSATNPGGTGSLLKLVGDPSGFLSTLATPKSVEFQNSNLSTNKGQSLVFVGGDIRVNGGEWKAPEGRIELSSVSGTGTVGLNIAGNILSLSFPTDFARGNIFTDFSLFDVTGNNGGSIAISGRNIELVNYSLFLAGIATNSGFVGAQAGDITLNATESIALKQESLIGNQVNPQGTGNAGNIQISGRSLALNDGAVIVANTDGQGDAGTIKITATDNISLKGETRNGKGSGIGSQVGPFAVGKAGGLEITTKSLFLNNGAQILANTLGIGDAGTIKITVSDSMTMAGEDSNRYSSAIASAVEAGAGGKAGGVEITTKSLSLYDGTFISASTYGNGDANTLKITATDAIIFSGEDSNGFISGVASQVGPLAVGKAGGVEITTNSLFLNNGAQVLANTFGKGDAGTIKITANNITLDGQTRNGRGSAIASAVERRAVGKGGGIEITTNSLFLNNGAQISASTNGTGDAGVVKITATDTIKLDGEDSKGRASLIASAVGSAGVGKGGGVEIIAKSLFLNNGAQVLAATSGKGDAGNVKITTADTTSLSGEDSSGFVSAIASVVAPSAVGKGGGVDITTNSLSLTDGTYIDASTYGRGDAGNVKITATDTITMDGEDSNGFSSVIASQVAPGAVGKGGGIDITTKLLSLSNGGRISASTASGNANSIGGDINILANILNLNANSRISTESTGAANAGNIHLTATQNLAANNSQITASAESAGGGNITINAQDIRLRDRSPITTRIGAGTKGGNILINSDIFIALEDSDILATAVRGDGGQITISSGVFIADIFANGGRGAISGNTDVSTFSDNNRVDISASSQFGTSGTVAAPDFTFLQNSLSTLAASFIDPDQVVSGSCIARRNVEQSTFTVTGKGGIPVTPYDTTSDSWYATPVNTSSFATNQQQHSTLQQNRQPQVYWKSGEAIAEAQGIVVLADGRKLLGLMPQQLATQDAASLICH